MSETLTENLVEKHGTKFAKAYDSLNCSITLNATLFSYQNSRFHTYPKSFEELSPFN